MKFGEGTHLGDCGELESSGDLAEYTCCQSWKKLLAEAEFKEAFEDGEVSSTCSRAVPFFAERLR